MKLFRVMTLDNLLFLSGIDVSTASVCMALSDNVSLPQGPDTVLYLNTGEEFGSVEEFAVHATSLEHGDNYANAKWELFSERDRSGIISIAEATTYVATIPPKEKRRRKKVVDEKVEAA